MPVLAIAEVDQALARLDADHGEISANLAELEEHPGVRFLDKVPLTGISAARWASARARLDAMWAQFRLFEDVVGRAHAVRTRRARPGQTELTELTALLAGPSVVLAPQAIPLGERDLLGPAAVRRSMTLAQLVAEMTAAYREVAQVAAAADAVSSTLLPGVDRAGARLAEARRLAGELDLAAIAHPLLARLDEIEGRLNSERTLAMSDPLSLAERHTDNDDPAVLNRDIDDVHLKLRELAGRRATVTERLNGLAAAVAETETAERAAHTAAAITGAKILGFSPTPMEPLAPLRDRLGRLHSGTDRHWTRINDDVVAFTRDVERARASADTARDNAQALLDRRDELRGRVDAYRVKAARLRLSEDPVVDAHYRRAHDLLHSSPCDLAAATRAVTEYQQAITEKTASR
ncbi:hypothetical protein GPX89_10890 [Nocardia sp. ET3-3]|uniref:Uncharacterized protein n=1 Tax=Nocardia terrae TaxID=2675851 RepID=A0A7K1UTQ5_9NOCA|nr:hypothetical protein [Nocardia terrae]MVU77746.1 hypothetical protein [Nocardia terrae]